MPRTIRLRVAPVFARALVLGTFAGAALCYMYTRSPPATSRAPPPPSRRESRRRRATVAVCVGGWLGLSIPRRGASIAEHVLNVMPSDVFVAGTLRARNITADRVARALDGLSALHPWLARASIIPMPTRDELREALRSSGHWDEYKLQASKGGSGRIDLDNPASADPTTWIPIMMSPAIGSRRRDHAEITRRSRGDHDGPRHRQSNF